MSKVNLNELVGLPDPLLSDMFEFVIGTIPGGADPNPLRILCQQVTLPAKQVEAVEVALGGSTFVHAGRSIFTHDLSVTFVENRKMDIFNSLNGWNNFVRDHRTQTGNYKEKYATSATLNVFDQMGKVVKSFEYFYLWISQTPEYQFDGSGSNAMTVSATFQYDWWEPTDDNTAAFNG